MWSSLALSWYRIRTSTIITIMRIMERGTTTAMMMTLPEVGGVVAAGVVFTDGDVVSGKLIVRI